MPKPKWLNDDDMLSAQFEAGCDQLRGNARNLKVGDLWRLAGWVKKDDLPKKDQPRLQLNTDELNSIADSFTCHLQNTGQNAKGVWTYSKDYMFSCCCCCACAVVVLPVKP